MYAGALWQVLTMDTEAALIVCIETTK